MVKFSEMSRGQVIGLALAALVFAVGLAEVVREVRTFTSHLAKTVSHIQASKSGTVITINNANFDYITLGRDDAWTFDDKLTAFDQSRGVVKCVVTLKQGNVTVTISQQKMPDQLKPRGSDKYNSFVDAQKPMSSQDVGLGKVYYLPALVNGSPAADGSDTIIYATDDILMFGRAGAVLKSDTWMKLLTSMQKTAPK